MRSPEEYAAIAASLAEAARRQGREHDVGMKLGLIANLIRKEIPTATRQQCLAAARQIMFQMNIKEAEIIG